MPIPLRAFFVPLLCLAALSVNAARADWLNLTGAETAPNIAEITVLENRVRLVLEVYVGDLDAFKSLVPDDWLKADVSSRPSLADRLERFSTETFQVVTGDGRKLPADLKLVEARLRKDRYSPFAGSINPTTRQRVPEAPEDKRVLYAEIEYPFDGRAKTLTFVPPSNNEGIAAVTIGFIAYHKSVPIIDFRYLSGPATVTLDWTDPWYTKFDNPNLKRHHKSALMSFLYVEPREVRHEALIRVRDLQDWTDLGLNGGTTIAVKDQAAIKQRARDFFAGRNPLKVDDVAVLPASSRAEFLTISLTGVQVIEEEKPLDLSTALLGIILSYPVKHLPQHVSVRWDLFNERVRRIPAMSFDPAGPFPSFIEASDPTFEWRNYLRKYQEPKAAPVVLDDGRALGVPMLSAVLMVLALAGAALAVRPAVLSRRTLIATSAVSVAAATLLVRVAVIDVANPFAGAPEEEAAAEILTSVLENVNHAYLEKDAAALDRALGVVVAADARGDVETELGRALAIKVAGGGIARVDAIEELELTDLTGLEGRPGFRSLAAWTARASAGHWGHTHRRVIRFRALVEIVDDNGAWKLAGITVVDAKRQGRAER
jgi:hypothetical protein